jgi:hypothetical protein
MWILHRCGDYPDPPIQSSIWSQINTHATKPLVPSNTPINLSTLEWNVLSDFECNIIWCLALISYRRGNMLVAKATGSKDQISVQNPEATWVNVNPQNPPSINEGPEGMWLWFLTQIATYQKATALVVIGPQHDNHQDRKDFPVSLPKELWYLFSDLHLEELCKGEILARLIKRKSCFSNLPPATIPSNLILDLNNLQLLNPPAPQPSMDVDKEELEGESKTNWRLFQQLYLMIKSYIGTVRVLQDSTCPNMQPHTPTPFPTGNMFATPTCQAPYPIFSANGLPMSIPLPSPPASPRPSPVGHQKVLPHHLWPLLLPGRSRSPMGSSRTNTIAGTATSQAILGQSALITTVLTLELAIPTTTRPSVPNTSPKRFSHLMRRRSLSTRPSVASYATCKKMLGLGSGAGLAPTRA